MTTKKIKEMPEMDVMKTMPRKLPSKKQIIVIAVLGLMFIYLGVLIGLADENNARMTNTGKEKIISVITEGDHARIEMRADDNINGLDGIKSMSYKDAEDVFIEIYGNPEYGIVNSADVVIYFDFIDMYGQMTEEKIMILSLTRETYNEINWDSVYDLESVLDDCWLHPGIK